MRTLLDLLSVLLGDTRQHRVRSKPNAAAVGPDSGASTVTDQAYGSAWRRAAPGGSRPLRHNSLSA